MLGIVLACMEWGDEGEQAALNLFGEHLSGYDPYEKLNKFAQRLLYIACARNASVDPYVTARASLILDMISMDHTKRPNHAQLLQRVANTIDNLAISRPAFPSSPSLLSVIQVKLFQELVTLCEKTPSFFGEYDTQWPDALVSLSRDFLTQLKNILDMKPSLPDDRAAQQAVACLQSFCQQLDEDQSLQATQLKQQLIKNLLPVAQLKLTYNNLLVLSASQIGEVFQDLIADPSALARKTLYNLFDDVVFCAYEGEAYLYMKKAVVKNRQIECHGGYRVKLLNASNPSDFFHSTRLVAGEPIWLKFLNSRSRSSMTKTSRTRVPEFLALQLAGFNAQMVKSPDWGVMLRHGLAMDRVEGITLQAFLAKNNSLSNEKKHQIFKNIILALIALHQKGMLHNDIKLDNIMIQDARNLIEHHANVLRARRRFDAQ